MGLQIKTFKDILTSMSSWVISNNSKLNNFRVGSVVRTLLEAVAIEIEALYFKMRKDFTYAVEYSIASSFNFYPNPATAASGTVTIKFKSYLTQRVLIPKGFRFSTASAGGTAVYFETVQDVLCDVGTLSAVLDVVCTQTGKIGNVPANTVQILVTSLPYVESVYNEEAFVNGKVEETKAEYKKRFAQFVETLARGTINAIQYGCLKVPGVAGAYVDDQIGEIRAYVHDSSGNLSEELKQSVIDALIDYRPAGTEVLVSPVVKKAVDVGVEITLKTGFDPDKYRNMIQTSVEAFLNNYVVSKSLTRAELITFTMSIDKNAIANVVLSLTADVPVQNFELVRAGVITVEITE